MPDVGASAEARLRYTLEDVHPRAEQVVARGYELRDVVSARSHCPQRHYAVFDRCSLPLRD